MPVNFADKSSWNAATGQLNNTNTPVAGEALAWLTALGGPSPMNYGSQGDVGKRFVFTEAELTAAGNIFTLSTGAALYGGVYQLVQVSAAATAANVAAGKAAFFLDTGAAGYVVTDEAHAVAINNVCGVFLNSVTPGNFGWICVGGKVGVLYNGVLTAAAQLASVLVKGAGDGSFDASAAAITGATLGQVVGVPIQLPVISVIKTVFLRDLFGRY